MPKLHLVYNFIDDYSDLEFPLSVGLVFALFVFATISYYLKKRNIITYLLELLWQDNAWNNALFASFFIGVIFSLICSMTIPGFLNLREICNTHQLKFVEGRVTDFDPMPGAGHRPEFVKVKDVWFGFSEGAGTGGYKKTAVHGGVFKKGLYVKIGYYPTFHNNLILWLETE
ncbi:hypothetical protein HYN43_023560 [Mucilaginibacter celer]|uniref:Uncharacterized protein n=2 Tax=Mucilaginibacter celer TaxID=2305508 RepID=A0A494VX86_9SPHI|nr:hypothetical protein HYN43_023560 [Mucilaginibacter celer]